MINKLEILDDYMNNKKIIIGVISAIVCEALYGLSYIFTKNATEVADTFSILAWRFFIAFLVMFLCVLLGIIKIDLKEKPLKKLLFATIFSPCLYFLGETIGISHTTASESGVFLACIPVVSLSASALLLKNKPSKIQVLGVAITLIGVIMTVVTVGFSSSFSIIGYSFLILAIFSYVLYSIFVKTFVEYTGFEITFVMLMVGSVVFMSIAILQSLFAGTFVDLISLPFREKTFAVAVLFQGIICSVIAFFLSNVAIANIGVNKTASFIGISTVVSILAGALILNEDFTIYQVIGAVIIISGVYIANIKTKEKAID